MVQRDVNCRKTTAQGPSNGSVVGKSGKDDGGQVRESCRGVSVHDSVHDTELPLLMESPAEDF